MKRQVTRLRIWNDDPVSASPLRANTQSMVFNIGYIMKRNPVLAVRIMELYDEARNTLELPILENDNEDFHLAHTMIRDYTRRHED